MPSFENTSHHICYWNELERGGSCKSEEIVMRVNEPVGHFYWIKFRCRERITQIAADRLNSKTTKVVLLLFP